MRSHFTLLSSITGLDDEDLWTYVSGTIHLSSLFSAMGKVYEYLTEEDTMQNVDIMRETLGRLHVLF